MLKLFCYLPIVVRGMCWLSFLFKWKEQAPTSTNVFLKSPLFSRHVSNLHRSVSSMITFQISLQRFKLGSKKLFECICLRLKFILYLKQCPIKTSRFFSEFKKVILSDLPTQMHFRSQISKCISKCFRYFGILWKRVK